MIDWIKREVKAKHRYKLTECSSFMFVMNMHFEIESKRYIYSLLKFWLRMTVIWGAIPYHVIVSTLELMDCKGRMKEPDIGLFYNRMQYLEIEAEHHRANIANSLWLSILAPMLIACFAFTHIKKEN